MMKKLHFNMLSLRIASRMQKTHTSGGLNMSRGFKAILIPGCFMGEEISDVGGV